MDVEKQTFDSKGNKISMNLGQGRSRNGVTATILSFIVFSMVGLAYASEPLYRIFCQVTGYGNNTSCCLK